MSEDTRSTMRSVMALTGLATFFTRLTTAHPQQFRSAGAHLHSLPGLLHHLQHFGFARFPRLGNCFLVQMGVDLHTLQTLVPERGCDLLETYARNRLIRSMSSPQIVNANVRNLRAFAELIPLFFDIDYVPGRAA